MADLGILQQAVDIKECSQKTATHFALCNGNRIRYLIALSGGKRRLSRNISTYSYKLELLMKLLNFLPFAVLKLGKLGYFVEAKLHPAIEQQRKTTRTVSWNVIVGTYDEKQKLVIQCFDKTGDAVFMKVGNQATAVEMDTEICFLSEGRKYKSFDLPVLLGSSLMSESNPFNIQMTKEFRGEKVNPVLTDDIIRMYRELSAEKKKINGVVYERSHGDFTPWNLKKMNGRYTLFDWEHCGYRMKGFDIIHFVVMVEVVMNGKSFSEAFDTGFLEIKKYLPELEVDKQLFLAEFRELRIQIA